MRKSGLLTANVSATVHHSTSIGWIAYRCGLALAGILWVCLATTLCGCNQASGWAVNRSGMAYFRQGNYDAARFEFERALVNNPYRADYAYNIAKTMEAQGDYDGAEQMFQYALTLDPAHELSYHGLTEMLVEEGREDDARTLLQAWAETQPYLPESNMEMARWQQRTGDLAGAQQSLNRALTMSPNNPTALGQMGYLYEQSQQPSLAAAYYQQSLMLKPNQPEVKARLNNIGWTPGQTPALALARRVTIMDPSMNGGMTLAGGPRRYFNQSGRSAGPTIAPVGAWQYGPSPMGSGSTVPMMGTVPMPAGMSTGMGPPPWGPAYTNPQMSMPLNYNTSHMASPQQMNYSTAMMPGGYSSEMTGGTWTTNMPASQYGAPGVPTTVMNTPQQYPAPTEMTYAPQGWTTSEQVSGQQVYQGTAIPPHMLQSPGTSPATGALPQQYLPEVSSGLYSPPAQMGTAPSVSAF